MNLYEATVHIYFGAEPKPTVARFLLEADRIADASRAAEKLADDGSSVEPSNIVCVRAHRVTLPLRLREPEPQANRAARRAKK